MSFTKHKEFQRQLDFQKDRLIDALKQHLNIFKSRELYGDLDTPVVYFENPSTQMDDETIEAFTEAGLEVYLDGNHIHTLKLEELDNPMLIKVLKEVETTQWNVIKEELEDQ
jgi:hypothetical protein